MESENDSNGIIVKLDFQYLKVVSRYSNKFKTTKLKYVIISLVEVPFFAALMFDYRFNSLGYNVFACAFIAFSFYMSFSHFLFNPLLLLANIQNLGKSIELNIVENLLQIKNHPFTLSVDIREMSILQDKIAYCIFLKKRSLFIIPKYIMDDEKDKFLQILEQKIEANK